MQNTVQLPFITATWQIKLPTVVRYLEKGYVENFFSTGELMLASVKKFHQHADEQRGDTEEGLAQLNVLVNETPVVGLVGSGSNAFILSTSCIDDESLMQQLNYDAAIRIVDTIGFAAAIAECIPFFRHGTQGYCIYRDSKRIMRKIKKPNLPDLPPKTGAEAEKYFHEMNAALAEANAHESLFRKALRYASQAEYRFIWFADSAIEKDSIIIKCPKAIQFCEKIDNFPKDSELSTTVAGAKMSILTQAEFNKQYPSES